MVKWLEMGDLPPLPPPPASETLLDRQRVRALRASSYFWLAIVPVLIVLLVFERIGGRPPWPLALALVAAIGVALAQRQQ